MAKIISNALELFKEFEKFEREMKELSGFISAFPSEYREEDTNREEEEDTNRLEGFNQFNQLERVLVKEIINEVFERAFSLAMSGEGVNIERIVNQVIRPLSSTYRISKMRVKDRVLKEIEELPLYHAFNCYEMIREEDEVRELCFEENEELTGIITCNLSTIDFSCEDGDEEIIVEYIAPAEEWEEFNDEWENGAEFWMGLNDLMGRTCSVYFTVPRSRGKKKIVGVKQLPFHCVDVKRVAEDGKGVKTIFLSVPLLYEKDVQDIKEMVKSEEVKRENGYNYMEMYKKYEKRMKRGF